MDVKTQLKNDLSKRERIRAIINHPSIHVTLIISVLNITVGSQICALDVDRRISSSQIFLKRTLRIRNFTGTRKSLKLMRTDRKKIDNTSENSTDKSESQNIYASMARMPYNT